MATPRFLFDEDLQGVGTLIQRARSHEGDVWVIGHEPCRIKKGTPDEQWLPVSASMNLIVFRLDNDLLVPNSGPARAWRENGCRGFVLSIQQSRASLWNQLRALIKHWDRIENHARDREGDSHWIGRITANRVKPH